MPAKIRCVDYYYTTARDRPGEAYRLLSELAATGVNLLAFTAIPVGPDRAQLTIFPHDVESLPRVAKASGLALSGPHKALLVQGDDELGALAGIHRRLLDAGVNVYASSGMANGNGDYGYLLYLRPEEVQAAANALGI